MRVCVIDTGCGIPPEIAERLFEPFLTSKKTNGIGMGLSICRTLIEAHGGCIGTQRNPGGGTMFEFIIPAGPE